MGDCWQGRPCQSEPVPSFLIISGVSLLLLFVCFSMIGGRWPFLGFSSSNWVMLSPGPLSAWESLSSKASFIPQDISKCSCRVLIFSTQWLILWLRRGACAGGSGHLVFPGTALVVWARSPHFSENVFLCLIVCPRTSTNVNLEAVPSLASSHWRLPVC